MHSATTHETNKQTINEKELEDQVTLKEYLQKKKWYKPVECWILIHHVSERRVFLQKYQDSLKTWIAIGDNIDKREATLWPWTDQLVSRREA